jgi:hypothetical protein
MRRVHIAADGHNQKAQEEVLRLCVYISHTLKRDIHTGVTAALAADGYTEVVCISQPLPSLPHSGSLIVAACENTTAAEDV